MSENQVEMPGIWAAQNPADNKDPSLANTVTLFYLLSGEHGTLHICPRAINAPQEHQSRVRPARQARGPHQVTLQ